MNQREKFLAIAVGGLLAMFVIYFSFTTASGMIAKRRDRIEALESELKQKKRVRMLGMKAAGQMKRFSESSLASNLEVARSEYQHWLLEEMNRMGLHGTSVKPQAGRPRGDVAYDHDFHATCQGDLRQVSEWLHAFYSKDILHRISLLSIKPVKESDLLDVTMQIRVLSLADAPPDAKIPAATSNRLAFSRDQYLDAILNRNMFGPPNNAPELTGISSKRVDLGSRFSLDASARDKDQRQKLKYSLAGEVPSGMRIDRDSGRIEWSPRELGEYAVTVRVADNGLPSKADEATLRLTVVDPPPAAPRDDPPPRPRFNTAAFSQLTAIIERNGRPQAWINVRPEGKLLKVGEGERVDVGEVTGVVEKIESDRVTIHLGDDVLIVALQQMLAEGERVPAED